MWVSTQTTASEPSAVVLSPGDGAAAGATAAPTRAADGGRAGRDIAGPRPWDRRLRRRAGRGGGRGAAQRRRGAGEALGGPRAPRPVLARRQREESRGMHLARVRDEH